MKTCTTPTANSGFTLVELSVVLVIIGLLVAGVMGGQSLIRGAELRSVITDVNGFKTAINVFREKYEYLPGDMPNAQSYWPSCVDVGGNACNGDGNGIIWAAEVEHKRAWQHLSLAGIIPGSYSGLAGYIVGVDVPGSKIKGGGYFPRWSVTGLNENADGIYGRYDNAIWFAVGSKSPIVSAVDAASIDKKVDDGIADKGDVFTGNADGTTNPDGNADCVLPGGSQYTTAAYNLNNTIPACRMWFFL